MKQSYFSCILDDHMLLSHNGCSIVGALAFRLNEKQGDANTMMTIELECCSP